MFPVNNIRAACETKGITLAQLERALGIGNGVIARWENSVKSPPIDRVIEIAKYLEVTVSNLLGEDVGTVKKAAPSLEDEAVKIGQRYSNLSEEGKGAIRALLDYYGNPHEVKRQTKIIPLYGNSFAAGSPEPDFGNMAENYEVDANNRAEFAIKINGVSMEPRLKDGSIALGVRRTPKDGEIAAFMLDGGFLVKQFFSDSYGNVYLNSLNKDCENIVLNKNEDHTLLAIGVIL